MLGRESTVTGTGIVAAGGGIGGQTGRGRGQGSGGAAGIPRGEPACRSENRRAKAGPCGDGGCTGRVSSLAKSLGIDEAKVKTALEELRTEAQKNRAAALKPRLDQAVADGTLTQADAVTKAVEQGVIGGGRH